MLSGLVTLEGAKSNYGVVINGELIDDAATQVCRAEMATKQKEPQLFNFGGDIEELRARCEAETGLPAPQSPRFAHLTRAAE